jgi:diaminopimelate decarboxylase
MPSCPGTSAGDLLVALCTGAYHHAMASNSKLVPRPAVIAVSDGMPRVRIREDADLLRRDIAA